MITDDKITEIFCMMDEFCKNLDETLNKQLRLCVGNDGKRHRDRKGRLSESEIMTILVAYHFGTFSNFKSYYLFFIKIHMHKDFPDAVSYNRFVELMPRVFFKMMLFMYLQAFGKCSGISFVDSTMIPICNNMRRYFNKVLPGSPPMGRELWAGATVSSCTSCATIPARY